MLGWFSLVCWPSGEATRPVNERPDREPPSMQCWQLYWTFTQPSILLRGVACHVKRPDEFFHVPSSIACSVVGWYVHFVASPALALTNMLTFWRFPWCRNEPKNQTRSRTIGPPKDGLTSHSFSSEIGVRPDAACSDDRFSPWNELFAKLKNMLPLNMLPPCLLTMFNCGPPVTASPRAPLRVTLTSCALPISGVYPETPIPW